MIKNPRALTSEEMWKTVGDILIPYGLMPDKASMDYKEVRQLYADLVTVDAMFRDLAQIIILKSILVIKASN